MKLKDEVSDRIAEKIRLLKTRSGHKKLLADLFFPSREKGKARRTAEQYADILDKKIKELESLIRSLRSHIDYIGDPDKYVASYLLIGKAYISLKAIAILVRGGYSFQIVELTRSSIESLSLSALFLEKGQEKLVERWFHGEIIGNSTAREVLDRVVNEMNKTKGMDNVPMKDALSDIYSIYSSYTHSGYAALFDFIDPFKEDFDFEQYTQFHYNRKYLHLIDNLYVNILLALKNFYIQVKDEENLTKVEQLLAKEGETFASSEEIKKEMERYK